MKVRTIVVGVDREERADIKAAAHRLIAAWSKSPASPHKKPQAQLKKIFDYIRQEAGRGIPLQATLASLEEEAEAHDNLWW